MPEQIAVLLALTANLFDRVPLAQMGDAAHAVHQAAAKIPEDVRARFAAAKKMSGEDRKAVIEIVRQALAAFQPETQAEPRPGNESEADAEAKEQA